MVSVSVELPASVVVAVSVDRALMVSEVVTPPAVETNVVVSVCVVGSVS